MNANKQDAGGLPNELGFEQWYVTNTFDYPSNPLGSRDCSIARKAWHAALDAIRNGEQCRAASGGGDVCATCQGHGMIGWITGQTPEQFDQHEAPCPDCSDNASPVAPTEIESVIERLAAEAAACITVLGRAPEASDVRVMLDAAKLLRALSRGVPEGMVARECPHRFRCDCLGACKYGLAGNGAESQDAAAIAAQRQGE